MVDLARKLLLYEKTRFAITVSGVGFAVTLVFVQIGLFLGLLDNASVSIERAEADLWVTARNTQNVDFANMFSETYVQRVRSVPGVARADNLIVWFAQVALPTGAKETIEVYALEDFAAWGIPWKVEGANVDDLRRGRYILLDESAKKRFGPFEVGEYREILGNRMKIIGKTYGAKSFTTTPLAFMDYRLAQTVLSQELRNRTTYVLVKLAPGADVETVRAAIRERLPYNDVRTKSEWAERSRSYWIVSTGLGLNMFMTVFLGCLVGVVVVAQMLYTSTMEHYREFGTVKAIGGSNGDIYQIIAKQAVIAAIVGFLAGTGLALVMGPLMGLIDLKLTIPPVLALWVFAGTVVLCLGASAISFRKIATLDPAIVFRG
jgi:putative ABC transport system permease protein